MSLRDSEQTVETPCEAWFSGRHRRNIVVFAVLLGAHLPLLLAHSRNLWSRPQYRFWPLLLLAVICLCWYRWSHGRADRDLTSGRFQQLSLAGALLTLTAAVCLHSPSLGMVAAILSTAAGFSRYGGRAFWTDLLGCWALLWLLVPLPFGLDLWLVDWLQTLGSRSASHVLDHIGVLHLMEGNVLEFSGQSLLAEEACNGSRWLFMLVALAASFSVWKRLGFTRTIVLIASALLWVGMLAILRTTTIAAAFHWWKADLSKGLPNWLLSAVLLVLALLLLLSTERLLWVLWPMAADLGQSTSGLWNRLTQRVRRRYQRWRDYSTRIAVAVRKEEMSPRPLAIGTSSTPDGHANRIGSPFDWMLIGGFTLLVGMQLVALIVARTASSPVGEEAVKVVKDALPEQICGWERTGFQSVRRTAMTAQGEFSKVWTYESSFGIVRVSMDYPFRGWNELTRCYRAQGWEIVGRNVCRSDGAPQGPVPPYVEAEFCKPTGERGYLLFGLYEEAGRPVMPPGSQITWLGSLADRLRDNSVWWWRNTPAIANSSTDSVTRQVQLFVQSETRLQSGQHSQLRAQYEQMGPVLCDFRQR